MKVCILTEADMKQIFSMEEAISAAKDAMALYSEGKTTIPLRAHIPIPKQTGQSLYMSGFATDVNALGVKVVSVYPRNVEKGLNSVPATMVLVEPETGEVCSLLNGTWLTRQRTGAVAGAATDILAIENASIGALIGTGGQAETQLEAMLTVRSLSEVRVYDLDQARAQAFCTKMSEQFSDRFFAKIVPVATSDEAIHEADIITAVTTSKVPVFDGLKVKAGAHVNGVGAFTPVMKELPENIIDQANPLVVDTVEGIMHEAGDLMSAIQEGVIQEDSLVELGAVIRNPTLGRASLQDITLFKTVGSAVLDVVTARRIYEKALACKIGKWVEF